ncbi:ABC transporter permease [Reticulibacter mediterranei]|uniref:ABC transporter permease n=1 Tax=Reticulibacter mediterranei TaxID=2778369 RepID=A0A8J3N060_9CHLR|nr:metal ABC transporter permease [Reticulibacter mediterranei]GHO93879.1 ABC transporter permease [Reticulibacter mediterranei]
MFSLFQYEFVQNAFLGGTIIAIVAAVVGYFVVLRAQAFAAEALTDIGFAGATGAAILGFGALLGMLLLTLLSALGMGALGERVRGRDIEIGMVLSFALGLGVLFLSLYTQNSAAHATAGIGILFGSILSIGRQDVWTALGCSCVILLVLTILFRPLLFASVDPEVAQARGVPVRLLSVAFLIILGATAAQAVMVIGVLLVSALLIAPAATAERLTHRPLTALLLSVVLSLAFTWIGLILAFMGTGRHLPVGFYISALAALSYFSAVLISRRERTVRREKKVGCCSEREERVPMAL